MKQYYNQLAEQVSISTSNPFLIIWKVFINFCSFIIYFEISLELFNVEEFQKDNRGEIFFIWRILILTLLLIDMIINLFIEYKNSNGIIIQKPYTKVKYYFRHYFIFDSIVVVYLFVSTFIALPFWVGFLVFFRIPSNMYSNRITEEYLIQYQFLLLFFKIFKLIVILLYVFDIFACAFYAMGLHSIALHEPTWLEYSNSAIGDIDQMHHLTQFIISYFWAVETLVSMGYGEITPMNQHEILIADIALVGCMFVCLYVISSIISFQQDNTSYLDEFLLSIRQFMIVKKISKKTYNEISIFLSQFRNEQAQRDLETEQVVIQRLPKQLKKILFYEANMRIVSQISWIKNNFSNEFIMELSSFFNEKYLNAKTKIEIINQNDDPQLFVIVKGKISILFNDIEIYELRKGDHFGSFTFFTKENEQFITYKTKSIVILYSINNQDFFEIATQYKTDQEKLFYIRDQVLFENNFQIIELGCFICRNTDHLTEKCSIISIKDQIYFEVRENKQKGMQQQRQFFQRTDKRTKIDFHLKKNKNLIPLLHTSFDIDIRDYSILQYQWKPIAYYKQPLMLIHLSQLVQDSLLKVEIQEKQNIIKWKKSSVFSSSNQYLFYWQLFMMFVNGFFFIAIPQIIFFWDQYYLFSNHGAFRAMRIVILLLFILDFLFQFNINYYKEGVLVKDRFKIAYHYLRNNLIFDLIPILVLFYMSVSDKYILVYLLCLVKLIPFYRFQFYLSDKLKIVQDLRQLYIIAGMLIEILYINHFFGCMFYAAGVYMYTYHPTTKTWVNDPTMNFGVVITRKATSKYLFSTYWAIDAITRIGYGDILPLNDLEFIITDLTVIVAVAIVAVNISFIENMRKNSKYQNYFADNLWIQLYLQKKNCSENLKTSISNYLRYYHRVGQDRNVELEQDALQLLPANLRMQLFFEAYGSMLSKQIWLRNQNILFEISNKVKEVYLGDMEIIFLDNQVDQHQALYYIDRGQIELFINVQQSNKKETVLALLKNDNFLGQYTFITGLTRKCSARTKIFASLIFITRKDFQEVLESNKTYFQEFQILRDKIIYEKKFEMIGLQCFTCYQNDHLSIDCPLISIKQKLLLNLKHNLRDKSQSGISLRKLLKPNTIQKRLFHLRKKKNKTKTIRIPQTLQQYSDYEPPRQNINFIIDKDLQILQ